jgi:hypothetical protein
MEFGGQFDLGDIRNAHPGECCDVGHRNNLMLDAIAGVV